jgi:pimeloyl-ACP methyl ester carboxylesterase
MHEIRFEASGVRLFALEEGSGPPIVMLHGGMANHLAARPLVAPLASRFRVVTPDLRASGKSHYGGALTFDQLADDLVVLLDHLAEVRAVVGGISGGSGVAVRFALRHSSRCAGLIIVHPMYAGTHHGYTETQRQALAQMDAVASRALDEGVQVLQPLYANLPEPVRSKALAMIQSFDAASVVTTSRFITSGVQPFATADDLRSITLPALLVKSDDPLHPAEISTLYAAHLPDCRLLPPSITDIASAIGTFCDELA